MNSVVSGARAAAENALWSALEDRRDQVRAAGLNFSERQHHQFREAHATRRLIAHLCDDMENSTTTGDEYYLRPMAEALKAGLETWEDVLIRAGAPWAAYVTPTARRAARRWIADARAFIPFL